MKSKYTVQLVIDSLLLTTLVLSVVFLTEPIRKMELGKFYLGLLGLLVVGLVIKLIWRFLVLWADYSDKKNKMIKHLVEILILSPYFFLASKISQSQIKNYISEIPILKNYKLLAEYVLMMMWIVAFFVFVLLALAD